MNNDCDLVDNDLLVWVLINQTETLMLKARQKELRRIGISPSQVGILIVAWLLGKEATPAELSRWLLREAQSISEILVKMEKDNLIKRVKDLKRKNMIRIVLTEKGLEVLKKARRKRAIKNIMSCLSEEEREQLIGLLSKVRKKALRNLSMRYREPLPCL